MAGSEEPHARQNAVGKHGSASSMYVPTPSAPLVHSRSSGRTKRFAAWALPVKRRQREQWQYWKFSTSPWMR